MTTSRTEKDALGTIEIQNTALWATTTQRSLQNFPIGTQPLPWEIIRAQILIKKASAKANCDCGVLDEKIRDQIIESCDELLEGNHKDQFPLVTWQTGSGTHTNMNVNEVIAKHAHIKNGGAAHDTKKELSIHPNDHVNKSQSTNDTFSAALYIAGYTQIKNVLLPGLEHLIQTLHTQEQNNTNTATTGRTHLMDATPITYGQVFGGYRAQLEKAKEGLLAVLPQLSELCLGGTAVGTGLNTPENFDTIVCQHVATITNMPFCAANNKYALISAHDALVLVHGAIKTIAVAANKIAHDIRMLGSGPRCGLGELMLPANELGSSIMPGKINPSQAEALTMVISRVIGNDTTITNAAMQGHFQLNAYKPVLGEAFVQSVNLLGDALMSFSLRCVAGIKVNTHKTNQYLQDSLMLVTALAPHIGYEKATQIAQKAEKENRTLKECALELGFIDEKTFDDIVDPLKMV